MNFSDLLNEMSDAAKDIGCKSLKTYVGVSVGAGTVAAYLAEGLLGVTVAATLAEIALVALIVSIVCLLIYVIIRRETKSLDDLSEIS